jgi:hypothetical protein
VSGSTRVLLLALLPLSAACTQPPAAHRAEIVSLGPSTIQIVPAEGQPPFCLVYTASETGVVRMLTMNEEGASFACPARQPIGGTPYKIPPGEGKVRIYVIFSDKKLEAAPVSAQVHEMGRSGGLTAMDLRAPGVVVLETLEVTPSG